jgi:arylsulfatase A-like enzyme
MPQVSDQVTITMDWLPTLLAAAGSCPDPAYPSDGDNILPVLLGERASYPRTLYWRYKAQAQRAVRDGDWKYLKINDNEFLFNVVEDTRERANLCQRCPEVFARLQQQWEDWNAAQLPITDAVFSHGVTSDMQADRYVPERLRRGGTLRPRR